MTKRDGSGLIASDADNEKASSLAHRPWELMGFCTQYIWLLCVCFGDVIYTLHADTAWTRNVKLCVIAALSLSYLCFYLLRNILPFNAVRKPRILTAGVLGALGTACVCCPSPVLDNPVIIVCAALAMGYCSSVMMLGGDILWSHLRPERIMMHLASSTLIACSVYYLLSALPFVVAAPLVCVMPLIGGVILSTSKAGKPRAGSFRKALPTDIPFRKLLLNIMCLSLAAGCALGLMTVTDYPDFHRTTQLALLGMLIASVFAFILAMRSSPARFLSRMEWPSAFLMVCGFVLLCVLERSLSWIGFLFVMAGYLCIDLFMWQLNAEIVFRTRLLSTEVLSRSVFIQTFGIALGFLIGCCTYDNLLGALTFDPVAVAAFCAILVAATRTFIFQSSDAKQTIEARTASVGEALLAERYAIIAEQYALSAREAEVFELLARGRSIPYIEKELSLSESTVKTHTRNIYRKFNVSSKQELLDIVDEMS